ncbi:MAG: hypothetical protein MRZ45_09410 [Blautia sp.]|nr:hypothetical protein [Blautia sp.]
MKNKLIVLLMIGATTASIAACGMGQEEYESKYGNPTELNFQILPQ